MDKQKLLEKENKLLKVVKDKVRKKLRDNPNWEPYSPFRPSIY